ncbi:hypothetical protein KWG64_04000 [Rahnella sp. PD12R]|uniref:SMI1/KNR4 family protein n=1 Tax=Rahnella sp. PD12R TaxID=2855688 RepID=UPI001C4440B6|nr:SMI1/KNR4 family protein [Rahnella sp. PD12R]MBV6817102.1 hypothetical protein [Rahnella sp. PD12R]
MRVNVKVWLNEKDKKYSGGLEQVLNDARTQGLPENWLPIFENNESYYFIIPTGRIRYWTLVWTQGRKLT